MQDPVENRDPVTVRLEPWELEIALMVGSKRTEAMRDVPDAAHYRDRPLPTPENFTLDQVGAIAEMGAAKYLCTYWTASFWPAELHGKYKDEIPDVEPNIEVRTVQAPHYRLAVREKDRRYTLIKSAVSDGGTVVLYGWKHGAPAWDNGNPSPWGDDAVRLVDNSKLRGMRSLLFKLHCADCD